MKLDNRIRYLQIAFNDDLRTVQQILPRIEPSDRIFIEAGTPFVKREGMRGIALMRSIWSGTIVADIKVVDGAAGEVRLARQAGANAITALGNSPTETLDLFVSECAKTGILAMIDMLGVEDPMDVLRPMLVPPDVIVLHRGRDEESTRGKVIQYRHVNRIRSKYSALISAAGGVTLKEARSAIFNGANIVVANLVKPGDPWQGISTASDVAAIAHEFLETIS